ncbi:MAG: universal stress protein [Bdellovibrionales bacterium]|nr:universal stress protein [Bdellovibrionales bacterium]
MRKILVTTDLSVESQVAFGKACELSQALNTSIVLLAVVEDLAQLAVVYALDFPVIPEPNMQKQLLEKVESELSALRDKFFAGTNCQIEVVEASGSVHAKIIETAREHGVELIVMATHGRTGLKRMLIGSVAERVVREACCPVLTVPQEPSKS